MEKNEDKRKSSPQIWTKEQEQLLAEWSEKASGYRWLHSRAEKLYRCRNYTFTIPVIILSTLTGTANFAMDTFVPEEYKQIAMACVGGVNIFAGILSTLQNFLRYAELMEGHRLALVSWSKFGRDIAVELALEPKMRKPAFDFLTVCRAEFDRLIEQSPSIDDDIIKSFKKTFKKSDIRVPEICNGLHRVSVYQPSQEEKVASIMANAASKIKPSRKLWEAVDVNKATNILEHTHIKHVNHEKKNDIHELKNLGKVSMFKDKINKTEKNIDINTPQEELKHLIKSDIENPEDSVKSIKPDNNVNIENDINSSKPNNIESINIISIIPKDNITAELAENSISNEGAENSISNEGAENSITTDSSENSISNEGAENIITTEGSEHSISNEGTENIITTEGSENIEDSIIFGNNENIEDSRNIEDSIIFGNNENIEDSRNIEDSILSGDNENVNKNDKSTQKNDTDNF